MSKRLGRGLDALLPSLDIKDNEVVSEVDINRIRKNPYQPRKEFDEKSLQELADSVKQHGIIQPLVVRKTIKDYELVSGERRLRAAKLANLKVVPIVVREFTDEQVMEIALIENLQRENLNPMEIAQAYEKLMNTFSLTQEELAKKVGKSRPHVANFLRLLQLPKMIQDDVSRGTLSMGHARALLAIKNEEKMQAVAKQVVEKDLSVRQLEELVKKIERENVPRETKKQSAVKDVHYLQYETNLRERFQTAVKIKKGKNRGKIEIEFYSSEDLDRILSMLVGTSER